MEIYQKENLPEKVEDMRRQIRHLNSSISLLVFQIVVLSVFETGVLRSASMLCICLFLFYPYQFLLHILGSSVT